MATTLLSDLLAATTENDVLALLIAGAQSRGLQTTDWEEGSPELTIMEMVAEVVNDLVTSARPVVVGGGFVSLANHDWLTLNAHERYDLDRTAAIATVGNLELTIAAGSGPYTLVAGTMVFLSASGLRFTGPSIDTVVNTAQNGAAGNTIVIAAEAPDTATVTYNVAAGSITTIATPRPGLSCSNGAAKFTGVTVSGTSKGTVVPTDAGTPAAGSYIVKITITGQIAAAFFQMSVDGGVSYGAAHACIGSGAGVCADVDGTGITLTFSNTAGYNPGFISGDLFFFTAPGTWYTTVGTAEESDATLALRCMDRWPSLSDVPTADKYVLWALAADPAVKQVSATASPSTAATVNIVIAGQGAVLVAADQTLVENYILPRTPISDLPVVALATAQLITLAGATVTVKLSLSTLTDAQTAAQSAMEAFFHELPIASIVRWAEVLKVILDVPGVVDCAGLTTNAGVINIALTSTQIATFADTLSSALTWVTIA